jgi:hypothetical protein
MTDSNRGFMGRGSFFTKERISQKGEYNEDMIYGVFLAPLSTRFDSSPIDL